jgi:CubicO group peptidase (beta-lactamase class C family)
VASLSEEIASGRDPRYPQSPSNASAVPIKAGQIPAAVEQLDGLAQDLTGRTGVPGMAIAVVHNDELVYARGFGVRMLGRDETVDEHTVFQLASVSKAISGTVVARAVGEGIVTWNDPICSHLGDFVLADTETTRSVTIGDLFAHRSGLPDHVGDVLEDLGADRATVLQRLRFAPLTPLRQDYAYTNFGLTAGALAVAAAAGVEWEDLACSTLYEPLGMSATSSRHADFAHRKNRATLHAQRDGEWVVGDERQPDAQSPAGGVSSSVSDLAQWMRLLLADGAHDGKQLIAAAALAQMFTPRGPIAPPRTPDSRTTTTGFGIDIAVDPTARVRWSHSGAFVTGAATNVTLLPSEGLGIAVLTNGWPVGLAEAVAASFLDLAEQRRVTFDWLAGYGRVIEPVRRNMSRLFGAARPSDPAPARAASEYAGTYDNDFYGSARVLARESALTLAVGPQGRAFELEHWDGDTFCYVWHSENTYGISAVDFTAASLRVENLDGGGLGTFTRR